MNKSERDETYRRLARFRADDPEVQYISSHRFEAETLLNKGD